MSSIPVGRSKIWASQSRGLIFSRRELITSNPKISQISVQVRSIFFLFCQPTRSLAKLATLCIENYANDGHFLVTIMGTIPPP